MKNILLFLFLSLQIFSQDIKTANAFNGLIVRESPDANSNRIGKLAYGSKVTIVEKTGIQLSIKDEGKTINGEWTLIEAINNNERGYVFSGFLTSKEVNTSKLIAVEFTKRLKSEKELASMFANTWVFIYHEDNRCSGSTDGKVTYSNPIIKIDNNLKIKVKNNSDYAWACEKRDAYYHEITFNLKEQLKDWDRIELQSDDYSSEKEKKNNTYYILGGGASDYITIQINDNNLISTIKYSSEDPG